MVPITAWDHEYSQGCINANGEDLQAQTLESIERKAEK